MTATRNGYWFVKWGDTVRITIDKTGDKIQACIDCYGIATSTMKLKFITSKVAQLRINKFRKQLLEDVNGWESPQIKNKLGIKV